MAICRANTKEHTGKLRFETSTADIWQLSFICLTELERGRKKEYFELLIHTESRKISELWPISLTVPTASTKLTLC